MLTLTMCFGSMMADPEPRSCDHLQRGGQPGFMGFSWWSLEVLEYLVRQMGLKPVIFAPGLNVFLSSFFFSGVRREM